MEGNEEQDQDQRHGWLESSYERQRRRRSWQVHFDKEEQSWDGVSGMRQLNRSCSGSGCTELRVEGGTAEVKGTRERARARTRAREVAAFADTVVVVEP